MNRLNLVKTANEILNIELTYMYHVKNDFNLNNSKIKIFEQWWGNTSGGFQGIGGSAMTKETTYVLYNDVEAYVFFSGQFGYMVEINDIFINDLKNENIAGKGDYKKKYLYL